MEQGRVVMAESGAKTFVHDVELVVEAGSPEGSLEVVERIVRAIHESDALPDGVRVRSYSVARADEGVVGSL